MCLTLSSVLKVKKKKMYRMIGDLTLRKLMDMYTCILRYFIFYYIYLCVSLYSPLLPSLLAQPKQYTHSEKFYCVF